MQALARLTGAISTARCAWFNRNSSPTAQAGARMLLLAGLLFGSGNVYAAVTSAIVGTGTTQAPTGSMPLCSLDPAAADLNVCTNDTLVYNIEYVTNGGDTALTIVSTLPTCTAATPGCPADGIIVRWETLPPQCDGAGSGISADGLALTCVRNGPINAGTARILPQARVVGAAPNNASIPTPTTLVTSPETAATIPAISTSGPVSVRAEPAFDLVKAPQNQASVAPSWAKGPDGVTDGWILVFSAAVRVPGGARGIEALDANGISWDDVVGNIAVTGTNALGTSQAAAVEAGLRANAVLMPLTTSTGSTACYDNGDAALASLSWSYNAGLPGGQGGPTIRQLATSGSCTIGQSGPGGTINARITDALWSNNVYPTQSNHAVPLPVGENYVSAKVIALWVPDSVFSVLPDQASIRITNTYTNVQGASISGQPLSQPNTANDTASINMTYGREGGSTKWWFNYDANNDLRITGSHTQDGVVVAGMPAASTVFGSNSGTLPLSGVAFCDKFDNTKVQVFEDAAFSNATADDPPLASSDYVIEYGTGGMNGAGASWANSDDYAWANCGDDQSPAWYSSRAAVPGGDSAITKVRVRILVPIEPNSMYSLRTGVRASATSPVAGMGVGAGHAWPVGTRINNWSSFTYSGASPTQWGAGTTHSDGTGQGWLVGGIGTTAYTTEGRTQTALGDTVTLIGASAEVTKTTLVPANSATEAMGGQPITYSITPTLTAAIATPIQSQLIVRDVLPPGLSFVVNSASMTPVVQSNTPAAGYTTLTWTLSNVPVGQPITPITFQAMVDVTLSNGMHIPNFTVVSSPLDSRPCATSGGVYDGILNNGYAVDSSTGNVTGTLCVHAARRDLRVSNPGGFQVNKTALTPQIQPGQNARYQLSWISVGNDLDNSDLIDVLPYNGDARGSSFNGTQQLAGALGPVNNDGTTPSVIYYTNASPASINPDPGDGSNALPGGSTPWCTSAQIGNAGCPAEYAQVTAIRVVSGSLQPDNVQRSLVVPLQTSGNASGNTYRNTFAIRGSAGGVPLTAAVTSPVAQIGVTTGSLSGRVFRDDNDDGVIDSTEIGIGGVAITLDGCASGPDGVTQTTAIAMSGTPVCSGDDVLVTANTTTANDGTYIFANQVSGLYRLTEAQPATYTDGKRAIGDRGGNANAQGTVPSVITEIALPVGSAGTGYNFGELFQNPVLTLIKQVTNDNGGTALPTDFTLTATGPQTISGIAGDAAVTNAIVQPGTYALSEINRTGYTAGTYSCVVNGAASVSANSVTLAGGDTAICTITNDDQPARLTLVKTVTNANGGTAVPADFNLRAAGPTPIGGASGTPAVTTAAVGAGTYTLSEDNLPGYVAGTYSCVINGGAAVSSNHVTLANGDSAVCTINNTDQPVSLTLVKQVVNDDGGTATPADFALTATGPVTISGATGAVEVTNAAVVAGTYELTETNRAGYTAGAWACSGGTLIGNNLTLTNGQNVTCTIVNDDQPAVLSINKDVTGDVEAVAGTIDEFLVRYNVVVKHVSGSAGIYTLTDTTQFDGDATVRSAQVIRGTEAPVTLSGVGPWILATDRPLAIGASETYQLEVRIQVAAGSDPSNDACNGAAGHGLFNLATLTTRSGDQNDDACAETPVPRTNARLAIEKRGSVSQAEMGDLVSYTVRVRNTGDAVALRPVIVDSLPAGFRLVEGQVQVRGARLESLQGAPGPELRITLDRIDPGAEVSIAYRVRIGVGALEGDGINRARAECRARPADARTDACSNEGRWKVKVTAGVFSEEGGIVGQVFVDCNFNSLKDHEELGIPGVRMYLEDGTYLISDVEGKYSYWGLRPTTHVLKVDSSTLPTRSRMVTSSPQNMGDAGSLFIDLKKGELHRADFIEGSCNNEVVEQVKSRRAQGEVRSVELESGQPALRLDEKAAPQSNPPQEGTDSANQRIEKVRHPTDGDKRP